MRTSLFSLRLLAMGLLFFMCIIGWSSVAPAAPRAHGRIVFTRDDGGNFEVFVMNADGTQQTNLSNHPAVFETSPVWSPDGRQIAFSSDRDGDREIYVMNADGTGVTNITNDPRDDLFPDWEKGKQKSKKKA